MTKYCKKCGIELQENMDFCKQCGTKNEEINNVFDSLPNPPINKWLILSNFVLIVCSLILGITATFDVNIIKYMNFDFDQKVTTTETFSVIKPVSVMIAEIIGLNNEYIMYFINIWLYLIAIVMILIPIIKHKTLKPVHFRMTKVATFVSVFEIALFVLITIFGNRGLINTSIRYSLNFSGWLMIVCTIATLVTSFIISHKLKRKNGIKSKL